MEEFKKRHIPFSGVHNFRDLGGYKSEDGRKVKWNTFYRSDKLSGLTPRDTEYFESLGIKTILDLRSKNRVKEHLDPKIDGSDYINISALDEAFHSNINFDIMSIFTNKYRNKADAKEFILNIYKEIVFDNYAFKELVDCMENEEKLPIVFHCTAGKDETGVAAALILSILGVPEETVIKDYMDSNIYRNDINNKIRNTLTKKKFSSKNIEILELILEVREEYLRASFKSAEDRYGSIDMYLEKEYGLTKKRRRDLKNRFLYN